MFLYPYSNLVSLATLANPDHAARHGANAAPAAGIHHSCTGTSHTKPHLSLQPSWPPNQSTRAMQCLLHAAAWVSSTSCAELGAQLGLG
eukprot:1157545-Pelagomonas_calceolata.AAC.2